MTQIPQSTDNFHKKLIAENGVFKNSFSFNFDKPSLYNTPPYKQALYGNLYIGTRNFIGKYQGKYLLYKDDETDIIRLKINSNDNECKLTINLGGDNEIKVNYEKDAIILKMEDFFTLFNEGKFYL